jgi:hypothetical protein
VTSQPIDVSAVQPAFIVITKLPDAGTTLRILVHVASAVLATEKMIDVAVTVELVTVIVVPAAAILTVPAGLFIVWFPVVPAAVTVRTREYEVAVELELFIVTDLLEHGMMLISPSFSISTFALAGLGDAPEHFLEMIVVLWPNVSQACSTIKSKNTAKAIKTPEFFLIIKQRPPLHIEKPKKLQQCRC